MYQKMSKPAAKRSLSIRVYQALDFTVVSGANLGDPISFADELDLDDFYELHKTARPLGLSLVPAKSGAYTVAAHSDLGAPGATVHVDSHLTLMSANGITTEILILVEVNHTGHVAEIYALPLAAISPCVPYALVQLDRDIARQAFEDATAASPTPGTFLTLSSGTRIPMRDTRLRQLTLADLQQLAAVE